MLQGHKTTTVVDNRVKVGGESGGRGVFLWAAAVAVAKSTVGKQTARPPKAKAKSADRSCG